MLKFQPLDTYYLSYFRRFDKFSLSSQFSSSSHQSHSRLSYHCNGCFVRLLYVRRPHSRTGNHPCSPPASGFGGCLTLSMFSDRTSIAPYLHYSFICFISTHTGTEGSLDRRVCYEQPPLRPVLFLHLLFRSLHTGIEKHL